MSPFILLLLSLIISFSQPYKILVGGDLDDARRPFYKRIAEQLATDPRQRHLVLLLTSEYGLKPLQKIKISDRLYYIGTPSISKLGLTLKWDPNQSEEENFLRLEKEQTEVLLSYSTFIFGCTKEAYDIGIGGLSLSDTIFFKHIRAPLIKLSPHDIESYTMYHHLGMPVMASTYPNRKVFNQYPEHLSDLTSFDYRVRFFLDYQLDRWEKWGRWNTLMDFAGESATEKLKKMDQEHALVLGEGANVELFQSVMPKPPNIRSVYPIVRRSYYLEFQNATNISIVKEVDVGLPSSFLSADLIHILNLELTNVVDYFYVNGTSFAQRISRLLNQLTEVVEDSQTYVVLLVPKSENEISTFLKEVKLEEKPNFFFAEVDDLFNSRVIGMKNESTVNWISSCTEENIFHALERYNVYFSSYYNPLMSTQQYLCTKLSRSILGSTFFPSTQSLSSITKRPSSDKLSQYKSQAMFHADLLMEERRNPRNIQYWIDYVVSFGISHKIPVYDKMGLIAMYNIDIYLAAVALLMLSLGLCWKVVKVLRRKKEDGGSLEKKGQLDHKDKTE